jgi:hypothetical protein
MIKAIETRYKGYRFRSRLEARWAVFFDALGIEYTYEKEGFDLDGMWYLPDFWLPTQNCWIEVKGQVPTANELRRAAILAVHTSKRVILFAAGPFFINGWEYTPTHGTSDATRNHFEEIIKTLDTIELLPCPLDEERYEITLEGNPKDNKAIFGYDLDFTYVLLKPANWYECTLCHFVQVFSALTINASCECWKKDGIAQYDYLTMLSPRLLKAHQAARQARFEHGESGAR